MLGSFFRCRVIASHLLLCAAICVLQGKVIGQESPPESPTVAKAQSESGASREGASEEGSATSFPNSWFGTWKGELSALSGGKTASKFAMELTIDRTDEPGCYRWEIKYSGEQGESVRKYKLVEKDRAQGKFVIDEGQGITLDASYIDGALYTHFLVQGNRLSTCLKIENSAAEKGAENPSLFYELTSASDEQTSESGGTDPIPVVRSWTINSVQKGRLTRQAISGAAAQTDSAQSLPTWQELTTDAYPGKQDDIYFVTPDVGWYVNGAGKIYKTTDSGKTWAQKLHKPGTYFRCIAFVDEKIGFAGNIGPGYFPNVSDSVALYQTNDGGETWNAVTSIEGDPVVGLCAIQVLREPFVNAGKLDDRVRIIGVGRVGGPTAMITSDDLGKTWQQISIKDHAAMAFDVYFADRDHGFMAAATDANVAQSNALILKTDDGGKNWKKVYQSDRPFELTWKISFPTAKVGYVTIQSYNPDPASSKRFVAKSIDGGNSWTEVPLIDELRVRQFGVAFLDENIGWVGATPNGFQTTDGGTTWQKTSFGNAVNKIRLIPSETGHVGYAIGVNIHRIELPASSSSSPK